MHGGHQASDQVATVLMLLRVERGFCCILLSLFDVPTIATRVANQRLSLDHASVQPIHVLTFRCLSNSTQRLRPGKAVEQGLRHALVIWRALLLTRLDHISAK